MRSGLLVLLVAGVLGACGGEIPQPAQPDMSAATGQNESQNFGEPLRISDLTPIAEVLDRPEEFVGKKIAVRGRVAEVCPNMGCWVDLEEGGRKLRIKVDDGVIVFPKTLAGKTATAEGMVERIEMSREDYEAYLRHEAEERGSEFDPAQIGDAPYWILRVRGTGAAVDSDS